MGEEVVEEVNFVLLPQYFSTYSRHVYSAICFGLVEPTYK